ncbi:hypothetical protein OBBRIDRAFT_832674 [Obba rivulosa]|uniref:Fungal-type protein kinase domain-containing protein n=1 Tax=Obba rivulosa TaxID=1052685 RepID=A0A8E2DPL7_9APHY|nr:hypothetical protein OBBRIDRAFT_832674 [Obba rivulosa]
MDEAFPVDKAIAPLLSELPPTHPNPVVTPNRHATSEPTKGNTPRKSNMLWANQSGKWVDGRVLQHIQDEFGNNCSNGCPLLQFFEQVLKVKPADIPTGKSYHISAKLIKKYCHASGKSASRHEKTTYAPFIAIIQSLIKQTGLPPGSFSLKALGDVVAFVFEVKNHFSSRSHGIPGKKDLEIILEFPQAQTPGDGGDQDVEKLYEALYDEGEDVEEPQVVAQASKGKDKAKKSVNKGKKRSAPAGKGVGSDKKRAKTMSGYVTQAVPQLDPHALQTSKYLNNLLSHNIRSHGISILLSHTRITMFYCDRVGVIISKTFDFLEQPQYLLLLAIAIATASLQTLGVSSLVQFPNSKFTTYKGASLTLTNPTGTNEKGRGEVINGTVEFDLDVTANRKIITNLGAMGRCTTVVPLKVRPQWVGRFGSSDVVGKIGWPLQKSKPEDETIRELRRRMRENSQAASYLQHIPELKCSLRQSMEDMGVPRAFMGKYIVEKLTRECQVLIMPVYLPLWRVNSIHEFKKVFTGAVRGHHWAWEVGNILHRDISATNVMFYRTDGTVVGVLNDWDLAVDKKDLRTIQFDLDAEIEMLDDKGHPKGDGLEERTRSSGAQNRPSDKQKRVSSTRQSQSSSARAESPSVRAQKMKASKQRFSQGNSSSQVETPSLLLTRQRKASHTLQSTRMSARASLSEKAARPDTTQTSKLLKDNDTDLPRKTGTGPFMALEVLRTSITPYHRYRFDLESFFYVLVWFCVGFDPKTQMEPPGIDSWQLRDFDILEDVKVRFLRDPQARKKLFNTAVDSRYFALLELWASRFSTMFNKIRLQSDQLLAELAEHMLISHKNKKAQKNSREKMQKLAADRELIVTFEEFMKVLELSESEQDEGDADQEGGGDGATEETDEDDETGEADETEQTGETGETDEDEDAEDAN